jgi:hypothetical protein
MSQPEREFRSKLAKLIHERGMLRGTLSHRERTCGKPTCRCAKGEKHASLYLAFKEKGKYRQIYVPKELEDLVTAWVSNHQKARDLLEEISRVHREKVLKRDL